MNPTNHMFLLFLYTHLAICNGFPQSSSDLLKNVEIDAISSGSGRVVPAAEISKCSAAPAEATSDEEFQMDSEVSRRILAMHKRYISYETLRRDAVPCSTPGASYYNCGTAPANRYRRGCEVITRCARSVQY